ncbi:MAG: hypothetical protein COA60_006795 [Robiginitomaculum sp.]|nr:hypothetical protein [Robiginitomaculum sp.]
MAITTSINPFLLAGAGASFIASFLHVGILFGGANWLRFFGAGEEMAQMAERGEAWPYIVTSLIAAVLFIWGLYALKGAGMVQFLPLPLLRLGLLAIASVFIIRGLVIVPAIFGVTQFSGLFWIITSSICLIIGLLYAIGLAQRWSEL